ncbi:polysaccharide deacetylase family protein [Alicyclobacillus acidocaldarius]|uniref:Polysaccharide deacetylase n=1 Tax=Alicyclobacillus acidocaldarius (strain Tc-4-1) TaxID=1048834 RepID=F8IHV1_ALIAT|nr:polysaccharide deacetylase family protein [Alicyclobacillus acidocaldarius]AEJ43241.1 polysaccharide deacetylase [Alicyclobacillus acidocaldarius subsp. acidocaldarius Tc-4-1]
MLRHIGSAVIGWLAATALVIVGTPTVHATSSGATKVVYLTFDDGPSQRYTPKLLDILRGQHIPATFFVVGYRCEQFPDIVRRIQREGHEIGNHGFSHFDPKKHALEELVRDIQKTDAVVEKTCGTKPLYYRPPYGSIAASEIDCVHQLGHPIALWTVDSMDWKAKSASAIVSQVERHAQPGSIILFHDGIRSSRYTIEAMPRIIRDFRRDGYTFKALPIRDSERIEAFVAKMDDDTVLPRDTYDVQRKHRPSVGTRCIGRQSRD